jgi:transposase
MLPLRRRPARRLPLEPTLIALYRRLKQRGKPHKAALVACASKLLIYANTVVARGTPWLTQSATT